MNTPNPMNDSYKAGLEQWQNAMQAWSQMLIETSQANLETWLKLREHAGALVEQGLSRSQTLYTREQEAFGRSADLWKGQVQAQMALGTQMWQALSEAGRSWTAEASRTMQAQAQAAQSQMTEMMSQASELAEAAGPANGARSRVKN